MSSVQNYDSEFGARLPAAITALKAGADLAMAAAYAGISHNEFLAWADGEGRREVEKISADTAVYASGILRSQMQSDSSLAERVLRDIQVERELERLKRVSRLQESEHERPEAEQYREAHSDGESGATAPTGTRANRWTAR